MKWTRKRRSLLCLPLLAASSQTFLHLSYAVITVSLPNMFPFNYSCDGVFAVMGAQLFVSACLPARLVRLAHLPAWTFSMEYQAIPPPSHITSHTHTYPSPLSHTPRPSTR